MKTEVIKIDQNNMDTEALERAAAIIRDGGLVAFPTETVYGLGADALSAEASKKIYAAKGRPSDNPLIVHVAEFSDMEKIAQEMPKEAKKLADAFWPGPLTMIVRKNDKVPYETTGGMDTVAVRMPNHPVALELIRRSGGYIAAPSANTSGKPSPTLAEHVAFDMDGRIPMILDGGPVGIGIESTIVDLTEDIPMILRPGYITPKMLEKVIGEVKMDPGIIASDSLQKPKAPGMKYRHYAPKASMTVIQGKKEAVIRRIEELAAEYPKEKVGILATDETLSCYTHGQVVSAGSRNEHTIEQGLYRALREFDHMGVSVIFSESFADDDRSEAIMNRLLKAAGQKIEYLSDK